MQVVRLRKCEPRAVQRVRSQPTEHNAQSVTRWAAVRGRLTRVFTSGGCKCLPSPAGLAAASVATMARRAAILQKLVDRLAAVVYPLRNCQESFALAAHFLAQQIRLT